MYKLYSTITHTLTSTTSRRVVGNVNNQINNAITVRTTHKAGIRSSRINNKSISLSRENYNSVICKQIYASLSHHKSLQEEANGEGGLPVTPFIVIPCHKLHKFFIQSHSCLRVKNTRPVTMINKKLTIVT